MEMSNFEELMKTRQYINKHGISIYVGCCSCAYRKNCNEGSGRICILTKTECYPESVCSTWKIKDAYENVGKGDGIVKPIEYFRSIGFRQLSDKERVNSYKDWSKMKTLFNASNKR